MPVKSLKQLSQEIYDWCERKGWNKDLVLGNQVTNCHCELSEAWEEIRNGHKPNEVYYNPDNPTKPEGFPIELADTIIRILHIAGQYDLDMDSLIELKMAYNETRPYRHGNKTA